MHATTYKSLNRLESFQEIFSEQLVAEQELSVSHLRELVDLFILSLDSFTHSLYLSICEDFKLGTLSRAAAASMIFSNSHGNGRDSPRRKEESRGGTMIELARVAERTTRELFDLLSAPALRDLRRIRSGVISNNVSDSDDTASEDNSTVPAFQSTGGLPAVSELSAHAPFDTQTSPPASLLRSRQKSVDSFKHTSVMHRRVRHQLLPSFGLRLRGLLNSAAEIRHSSRSLMVAEKYQETVLSADDEMSLSADTDSTPNGLGSEEFTGTPQERGFSRTHSSPGAIDTLLVQLPSPGRESGLANSLLPVTNSLAPKQLQASLMSRLRASELRLRATRMRNAQMKVAINQERDEDLLREFAEKRRHDKRKQILEAMISEETSLREALVAELNSATQDGQYFVNRTAPFRAMFNEMHEGDVTSCNKSGLLSHNFSVVKFNRARMVELQSEAHKVKEAWKSCCSRAPVRHMPSLANPVAGTEPSVKIEAPISTSPVVSDTLRKIRRLYTLDPSLAEAEVSRLEKSSLRRFVDSSALAPPITSLSRFVDPAVLQKRRDFQHQTKDVLQRLARLQGAVNSSSSKSLSVSKAIALSSQPSPSVDVTIAPNSSVFATASRLRLATPNTLGETGSVATGSPDTSSSHSSTHPAHHRISARLLALKSDRQKRLANDL